MLNIQKTNFKREHGEVYLNRLYFYRLGNAILQYQLPYKKVKSSIS